MCIHAVDIGHGGLGAVLVILRWHVGFSFWILVFKLEVLVFVTVGLIQIVMDDLSLPLSIFSRTRVIWI